MISPDFGMELSGARLRFSRPGDLAYYASRKWRTRPWHEFKFALNQKSFLLPDNCQFAIGAAEE